jgi:hypothetical protein
VTGRWRRRRRVIVVAALILSATLVTSVWMNWCRFESQFAASFNRGAQVREYGRAFEYYWETGRPVPDSLKEIIDTCSKERAISIQSEWSVPDYRPAGHLKGGPYIVLVSRPEKDGGLWVLLWAYPDGRPARNVPVQEREYKEALLEDDRRRVLQSDALPSVWEAKFRDVFREPSRSDQNGKGDITDYIIQGSVPCVRVDNQ